MLVSPVLKESIVVKNVTMDTTDCSARRHANPAAILTTRAIRSTEPVRALMDLQEVNAWMTAIYPSMEKVVRRNVSAT